MHPSFSSQQQQRSGDDYLSSLQNKLSLKDAQKNKMELLSHQNQYDNLFAQCSEPAEFNQLFNSSINQHHNFSQIDEQEFEEDSLFNDGDGGYFQQKKVNQNDGGQQILANFGQRMSISHDKSQQNSHYHHFQSKDANKILEILKMKESKQHKPASKSIASQRSSITQTKCSSKSLIIKPKITTHRSTASESLSSIKLVKKGSTQASSKRVKTESNQSLYDDRSKQICKTDYDNYNDFGDQRNMYCMIAEEKDSLECTFKPTLLKECLNSIKDRPTPPYIPARKSNQRRDDTKLQKATLISQSLVMKNVEKERKSLEIPKEKQILSKKSSAQASGSTLDVATRNQLWLLQKQERLSQKRKQQQEEKQKQQDFSFKPNINFYKKDQKAHAKPTGKEVIPPYFERLSMAKRKSTVIKFKRDQNIQIPKGSDYELREKNKENIVALVNSEKEYSQAQKSKKQTYEQAVKELHHKIMKMNI